MEDVPASRPVIVTSPLRDQRRTAALIAQYIHELSGRHADGRATVREPAGA
jgi:hypothetical protein